MKPNDIVKRIMAASAGGDFAAVQNGLRALGGQLAECVPHTAAKSDAHAFCVNGPDEALALLKDRLAEFARTFPNVG
jgi:hypothetical protein